MKEEDRMGKNGREQEERDGETSKETRKSIREGIGRKKDTKVNK
jgi:hypothetical protein